MKSRLMLAAILTLAATGVFAETAEDCFPACVTSTPVVAESLPPSDAPAATTNSCAESLVNKVDALNNQVRPVREIVGYVRSPQGLAVKLVNDHIFKIPAWVGFALDPIGTIKHKAIDEVRSRAKSAMGVNSGCGDEVVGPDSLSIDAA